jgi:hypothetical protein
MRWIGNSTNTRIVCISLLFESVPLKFVPWTEILIKAEIARTQAPALCVQDG